MYLVDSHCHLDFKDYDGEVCDVIQRAKESGIHKMLNICTTLDEIDQLKKTADTYEGIYSTVGIHPHDAADTLDRIDIEGLKNWLREHAQHEKVIAIGETGLDYHYDNSPRDLQQQIFRAQIEVACELDLPLSVHTRAAREDTIALLAERKGDVRGTIHCFSENQELADAALDLGFYISVSGISTFKKAQEIRDVLKTVPLDRLLLETDAPFLAPVPYRGKRNEPAYMLETAKMLAELRGLSLADITKLTTDNFYRLFNKATA